MRPHRASLRSRPRIRGLSAAALACLAGAAGRPPARATIPVAIASGDQEAACASAEHHRFDFWLGEWRVTQANGTPAGTNRIRAILDGCVVTEDFSTPEGYAGRSFSTYDARRGVWHQTWVDNANQLLVLEGGWRDSAMVLEGESLSRDGSTVRHRITWTREGEGDVRQLWEISRDGGRTFEVFFDGRYHRVD